MNDSPAGVISLNSADPTDTFEAYVTGGYEFEAEETFVEGAISGPLSDNLSARLALRGSEMEGWIDNVAEPVTDFIVLRAGPVHTGVQAPPTQLVVPWGFDQRWPQAPQWALIVSVLASQPLRAFPSQLAYPPLHTGTHAPALQDVVPFEFVQAWPHAPQ